MTTLSDYLTAVVDHGASDLHLKPGAPGKVRVDGRLIALKVNALTDRDTVELLGPVIPARLREPFAAGQEVDFGYEAEGTGRFRMCVFRSSGGLNLVARHVRDRVATIDELRLPKVMHTLSGLSSGLVLICGPTGSGKTASLAAVVDEINTSRSCHILSIEDPIEYVHSDKAAVVRQREIGVDTDDYVSGVRSAMRQDPDVIIIGEMRDRATVRAALQAAETGHLVCSSLHTTDTVDSLSRLAEFFPPHEQRQVRMLLGELLQAVVCQRLVAKKDGSGRVVATEVAIASDRFRSAVSDQARAGEIPAILDEGSYYGMHTFNADLLRLVRAEQVTVEAAKAVSPAPDNFEVMVRAAGAGASGAVRPVFTP